MKIYTKTGDEGSTSLFGGARVSKAHERIEAYGTIDELNSFIGLLIAKLANGPAKKILLKVQHQLFNIGSLLATTDPAFLVSMPKINQEHIDALESWMDTMDENLPKLTSFILPGGSEAASLAHVCRTVCRRAERRIVLIELDNPVYALLIPYVNRLSDAFFVFSRFLLMEQSIDEVTWKP